MLDLSEKILLDRILGKGICFFLIPLTRLAGIILHRDHSISDENVRCIAIAKYFGIGSIIHASPMMAALKSRYPHARFIFITRKSNLMLFDHFGTDLQVLTIDDRSFLATFSSTFKLVFTLIRYRIDLYFDLELYSAYSAIISLFSLARNRLGFFCGKETDFKAFLYSHLVFFNFYMPIRLCYLQLARVAHVQEDTSTDLIPLRIDHQTRRHSRVKLDEFLHNDYGRGLIAINVNASGLSFERRWPGERYAAVARHCIRNGYRAIFVGSPDEREYVQTVVAMVGETGAYNAAGYFSFSEFLVLLTNCRVLLTNDSGIMNIGFALNMAVLSLCGPVYPEQYQVSRPNTRIIYTRLYCSPCLHHLNTPPCKGTAYCMHSITVEQVNDALWKLVNEQSAVGHHVRKVIIFTEDAPLGILRNRGILQNYR